MENISKLDDMKKFWMNPYIRKLMEVKKEIAQEYYDYKSTLAGFISQLNTVSSNLIIKAGSRPIKITVNCFNKEKDLAPSTYLLMEINGETIYKSAVKNVKYN